MRSPLVGSKTYTRKPVSHLRSALASPSEPLSMTDAGQVEPNTKPRDNVVASRKVVRPQVARGLNDRYSRAAHGECKTA